MLKPIIAGSQMLVSAVHSPNEVKKGNVFTFLCFIASQRLKSKFHSLTIGLYHIGFQNHPAAAAMKHCGL
jgi:hypothetical protein